MVRKGPASSRCCSQPVLRSLLSSPGVRREQGEQPQQSQHPVPLAQQTAWQQKKKFPSIRKTKPPAPISDLPGLAKRLCGNQPNPAQLKLSWFIFALKCLLTSAVL